MLNYNYNYLNFKKNNQYSYIMINIPDTLKNNLIRDFKSIENIKKIIEKKEIYQFSYYNYNLTQLQKLFEINQTKNPFKDSNSKKILNKILDLIKKEFYSDKTENYLNILFNPTIEINELKNRRKSLKEIELNTDLNLKENINNFNLKLELNNINKFNSKINFNKTIITTDKEIEEYIYENFKLNITYISLNELEEYLLNDYQNSNKNTIIISDDNLIIEIPKYSLKEFKKLLKGILIKQNKEEIKKILKILIKIDLNIIELNKLNSLFKTLFNLNFNLELDYKNLINKLENNSNNELKELISKTLNLNEEIEKINQEIKEIISKKQLSLQGDELLNLLNSGDISSIKDKFAKDTKQLIITKEKEILKDYNNQGIKINFLFKDYSYPLEIDEEIREELLNKIEQKEFEKELEELEELGKYNLNQIKSFWNFIYLFDLIQGIKNFEKKYDLINSEISNEIKFIQGKNIFIDNPTPINYAIASSEINGIKLGEEKVGILTGANSGGKTTLLEMNLQNQILTTIGLGIPVQKDSKIKLFEEIIYLKKFTGTIGSGAFEQTIRNLVEILDSNTSKFILIDEFEAVTEPGAAAKILIMFLKEIINQNSFCIAASHLGMEINEFIKNENIKGIRIDGISASGLDENGNLITTHQPEFYSLGKSTPELILKRILQDNKFWKNKSKKTREILSNIIQQ